MEFLPFSSKERLELAPAAAAWGRFTGTTVGAGTPAPRRPARKKTPKDVSRTNAVKGRRPATIDEYLASVARPKRAALVKLRETIASIIPKATECISYGIPAFRIEGRVVAGFAATAKGCSYLPFSGSTLSTLVDELAGYDLTKSALHFDPAKPLPVALVRKLIRTRAAEDG